MASTAVDLEHVRAAPSQEGTVDLIVRRPVTDEREVLEVGELTPEDGLVGDKWSTAKRPNRGCQLTLMSSRAIALVAGDDPAAWPPAGDQLFVDLDLSEANVPAGTRLHVGDATIEITELPHLGCAKFEARYGSEARALVNSDEGVALHLRGVNARVVVAGAVRRGDSIRKA
jgi:MOSC domain-containing protein YiiM